MDRVERRFEIFATVLLSIAALGTAWSGYQASLWDGIQSSDYTQASAHRTTGAQRSTEANQFRLADLGVFESYLEAESEGNDELSRFYRERFRDEFEPAFEAWEALDPMTNPEAPPSPLAMPEYRLAAEQESTDLTAMAEAIFAEGEDANGYSDAYTLATLLFAAVLFFAAISERFEHRPSRMVLLGFATIGLIGGFATALSQPITTG